LSGETAAGSPIRHRRQGSKFRLSGALVVGLAAMWSLTLLQHVH
jgi:hypothetical protein